MCIVIASSRVPLLVLRGYSVWSISICLRGGGHSSRIGECVDLTGFLHNNMCLCYNFVCRDVAIPLGVVCHVPLVCLRRLWSDPVRPEFWLGAYLGGVLSIMSESVTLRFFGGFLLSSIRVCDNRPTYGEGVHHTIINCMSCIWF